MFVRETPSHVLNPAVFSLYTDVMADLISSPVMGARDLIFLRLMRRQSTVRVCFAVKRLSSGLDHRSGRSVRLDLHESNTLTEMQTRTLRN